MTLKKTSVPVVLNHDSLKELRKVLFSKGLTVNQFLSYVVELVSYRDERVESIMAETLENHTEYNGKKSESDIHDAETIYKMIELELQANKQNS